MKVEKITSLDEIKRIELGILDYVSEFCEKHQLKYFLAYGTLLGAVRHKGFIPWDDDVDICMPREDYKKFCELWGNENNRYQLFECEKNKEYMYPFAKVTDSHTLIKERNINESCDLGIYIDVFPYDSLEGGKENNQKFLKSCECLEKMRCFSMMPMHEFGHVNPFINFTRMIMWCGLKIIGCRRFARILNKKAQKYSEKEGDWVGCLVTQESDREIAPAKWYEEEILLEFEDRKYKAPKHYDEILTTCYGDYMELPPEEQRVLKHGFQAWKAVKE